MSKIIGKQVLLANQTYVDNSSLINVPNTQITGRAQILDPSKDLSVNMGVNRIPVQQVYFIQNEFGPNGENVWGVPNDLQGLIRFVGSWTNFVNSNGEFIASSVLNDFVEITFYGTGLNAIVHSEGNREFRATVDGGTEGGALNGSSSLSGITGSRNYSMNAVLNIASGLSLGIHTVKLRQNNSGVNVIFQGFEILNESSSIKINQGTSYISGASSALASQFTDSYNSNFVNVYGTAGSRGGRVLVYQKPDGSIAKDIQYTNTAQANFGSADHTNEEVVRRYNFREFGAGGVANDWSTFTGSPVNAAFALDDGTANLVASQVQWSGSDNTAFVITGTTNIVVLNFVGTGVDVQLGTKGSASDNHNFFIDGSSVGSLSTGSNVTQKIVSGLPYGTHTLKIARTVNSGSDSISFKSFIVYQPKTPALPSGCVQIADYNLMATYSSVGSAAVDTVGTGVLRKVITQREAVYLEGTGGTTSWSYGGPTVSAHVGGFSLNDDRQNAYYELTFFGTGFEHRYAPDTNRSTSIQVTLNGTNATTTNFPTMSSSIVGTGSFTASTGIFSQNGTSTPGSALIISNLPLAKYTVRFTNNNASQFMIPNTIDVITPIYADGARQVSPGNLQNTQAVGSQSIHDNRNVGQSSIAASTQKFRGSAIGITSGPTTTSSTYVPFQDVGLTVPSKGGWFQVSYNAGVNNNGGTALLSIFVDGVQEPGTELGTDVASGVTAVVSCSKPVYLSPGVHKVDVYWKTSGTSSTGNSIRRILTVEEL